MLIVSKNKKLGIGLSVNLIIVGVLNVLLKIIVRRPRPEDINIITESGFSFPSGHAMMSIALYGMLIYFVYKFIKNKGISTDNLKKTVDQLKIEDSLFKSNKDFGLVTVRVKDFKPMYVFKEDIKRGKLTDYLMASCYLPIFKLEKIIDDNYYLDGGFYDYAPANALIDRGYDKVYVVDLEAIGYRRKYKDKDKIIVIKPSRKLGSIININEKRVRENILMGYYDTLKIVKNYDGYKYIFKHKSNNYYRFLLRKVSKKKLKEMHKLFRTTNEKKLVLKALEYIMTKENFSYYDIYSPLKVIKKIKKIDKRYGVYSFVAKLQFVI